MDSPIQQAASCSSLSVFEVGVCSFYILLPRSLPLYSSAQALDGGSGSGNALSDIRRPSLLVCTSAKQLISKPPTPSSCSSEAWVCVPSCPCPCPAFAPSTTQPIVSLPLTLASTPSPSTIHPSRLDRLDPFPYSSPSSSSYSPTYRSDPHHHHGRVAVHHHLCPSTPEHSSNESFVSRNNRIHIVTNFVDTRNHQA